MIVSPEMDLNISCKPAAYTSSWGIRLHGGAHSAEDQKQFFGNVLRCSLLKGTTSENHVVYQDVLVLALDGIWQLLYEVHTASTYTKGT